MAKVIGTALPSAESRRVTPNGYCLMDVGTHSYVVIGGPLPPFHPNCRFVLQDAGTVDETLAPQTPGQPKKRRAGAGGCQSC